MNLEDHLFAGLLDAAPDAMVCVDGDGRIALVNAQAERLFGYGRDELVGQPVEILVPDAVRAVHPGHRAGYAADPRPRPMGAGMELAGRRRDGSAFPAEIWMSAIETEEGILVTAAVRDVTERLKGRQSQRLEGLGQLAGGLAHDFNNLLGVIINHAAFVAEELGKPAGQPPSQTALFDVEQIRLAAERATRLTRQLLTTVLLPVTDELPPPGEPAPGQPERGGGELVLLVEDEPAMREVARRILIRNGYQVISVASGQEAASAATACPDPISLLVTDVLMAGMRGRDLAARVSEIQPGIRVLYMSGYTEGLLSAQGFGEPAINLIEKPFTEASLLTKMRETLHAQASLNGDPRGRRRTRAAQPPESDQASDTAIARLVTSIDNTLESTMDSM
jgi:PAS domain S-box-containing protein